MQLLTNPIKSITAYDHEGYLVDYCPYCNDNVSYKYNKERVNHDFISETGYYDRVCNYKCNKVNKYFYIMG